MSVGRPIAPPACWRKVGRAQTFPDVFLDIVESDASLLGVLNIDVVRRMEPGVADAPHEGREVPGGSAVLRGTAAFLLLLDRQAGGNGSGLQKEGARQRRKAAD